MYMADPQLSPSVLTAKFLTHSGVHGDPSSPNRISIGCQCVTQRPGLAWQEAAVIDTVAHSTLWVQRLVALRKGPLSHEDPTLLLALQLLSHQGVQLGQSPGSAAPQPGLVSSCSLLRGLVRWQPGLHPLRPVIWLGYAVGSSRRAPHRAPA